MKKIVYITSRRLLPLDSGDKLLTYNILKRIRKYYDICLVNLNEGEEYTSEELEKIKELSNCFEILNFKNEHSVFKLAKSFFFNKMYWKVKLENKRIKDKIETFIMINSDAEFIVWDHLRSTIFFANNSNKNILIEHNNEADILLNRMNKSKNKIEKFFLNKQLALMSDFIRKTHKNMERVIFLSQNDFLNTRENNNSKYHIMNRLLINFEHKSYSLTKNNSTIRLLFIGSLDWYPNIEAIKWLLEDIMPKLKDFSMFHLNIVGRNPSDQIKNYINSYKNTTLHSNVPSVEDYYLNADLFLAPIKNGSGINIKVLEALSYGIPMVVTSFAKRGYDGLGFLQDSDSTETFADEILRLTDINLRRELHEKELDYYKNYEYESDQTLSALFR